MKKEKKSQNVKRIDECVKMNGPQEVSKEEVINIDAGAQLTRSIFHFLLIGGDKEMQNQMSLYIRCPDILVHLDESVGYNLNSSIRHSVICPT